MTLTRKSFKYWLKRAFQDENVVEERGNHLVGDGGDGGLRGGDGQEVGAGVGRETHLARACTENPGDDARGGGAVEEARLLEAVSFHRAKVMAATLGRWRTAAGEARAEREATARALRHHARVAAKDALATWREVTRKARQQRHAWAVAEGAERRSVLRRALRALRWYAAERGRKFALMLDAVRFSYRSRLRAVLCAWRERLEGRRQWEEWELEQGARADALRVRPFFLRWNRALADMRELRVKLGRAAAYYDSGLLARCLRTWRVNSAVQASERQLTSVALSYHLERAARTAFAAWRAYAEGRVARREAVEARVATARDALAQLRRARVMAAWVEHYRGKCVSRILTARARAHHARALARRALHALREASARGRRLSAASGAVGRARALRVMRAAMDEWLVLSRERAAYRAQERKALSFWCRQRCREGFARWRAYVTARRAKHKEVMGAYEAHRVRVVTRAAQAWAENGLALIARRREDAARRSVSRARALHERVARYARVWRAKAARAAGAEPLDSGWKPGSGARASSARPPDEPYHAFAAPPHSLSSSRALQALPSQSAWSQRRRDPGASSLLAARTPAAVGRQAAESSAVLSGASLTASRPMPLAPKPALTVEPKQRLAPRIPSFLASADGLVAAVPAAAASAPVETTVPAAAQNPPSPAPGAAAQVAQAQALPARAIRPPFAALDVSHIPAGPTGSGASSSQVSQRDEQAAAPATATRRQTPGQPAQRSLVDEPAAGRRPAEAAGEERSGEATQQVKTRGGGADRSPPLRPAPPELQVGEIERRLKELAGFREELRSARSERDTLSATLGRMRAEPNGTLAASMALVESRVAELERWITARERESLRDKEEVKALHAEVARLLAEQKVRQLGNQEMEGTLAHRAPAMHHHPQTPVIAVVPMPSPLGMDPRAWQGMMMGAPPTAAGYGAGPPMTPAVAAEAPAVRAAAGPAWQTAPTPQAPRDPEPPKAPWVPSLPSIPPLAAPAPAPPPAAASGSVAKVPAPAPDKGGIGLKGDQPAPLPPAEQPPPPPTADRTLDPALPPGGATVGASEDPSQGASPVADAGAGETFPFPDVFGTLDPLVDEVLEGGGDGEGPSVAPGDLAAVEGDPEVLDEEGGEPVRTERMIRWQDESQLSPGRDSDGPPSPLVEPRPPPPQQEQQPRGILKSDSSGQLAASASTHGSVASVSDSLLPGAGGNARGGKGRVEAKPAGRAAGRPAPLQRAASTMTEDDIGLEASSWPPMESHGGVAPLYPPALSRSGAQSDSPQFSSSPHPPQPRSVHGGFALPRSPSMPGASYPSMPGPSYPSMPGPSYPPPADVHPQNLFGQQQNYPSSSNLLPQHFATSPHRGVASMHHPRDFISGTWPPRPAASLPSFNSRTQKAHEAIGDHSNCPGYCPFKLVKE